MFDFSDLHQTLDFEHSISKTADKVPDLNRLITNFVKEPQIFLNCEVQVSTFDVQDLKLKFRRSAYQVNHTLI